MNQPLVELFLRHGDDALVHGHRLSEWYARGPSLEEDLAITNIALDCLGQAQLLLAEAGRLEGAGRDSDALAYFRKDTEFRNVQLAELPTTGDFALLIAKQFLFDGYRSVTFESLKGSRDPAMAAIAAKACKEISYHLRHSRSWVVRLGDGTEESKMRLQRAFETLFVYVDELFQDDEVDRLLVSSGACALPSSLRSDFDLLVSETFSKAELVVPFFAPRFLSGGGRAGRHTEHLGRMLAEMQSVARAHPGAKW